jgi:hypothetical protein
VGRVITFSCTGKEGEGEEYEVVVVTMVGGERGREERGEVRE